MSRAPPWVGLPGWQGSFSGTQFTCFTGTNVQMLTLTHLPGLHQPRLDWQMWFAALGSYERNPWLLVFVVRLLQVH
jgi:hypothetical protein